MLTFTALMIHEPYMQRCLQLAALGAGTVAPNPMVGAVLVYRGKIIGEGYHQQYGHEHAEVNCINSVLETNRHLVKESTLYVSLEPCNHVGKTGPCTNLVIAHNIPRVVIACKDPFEKVNGNGIEKLRENGIEVITGIMEKEALFLNRRFITFHQHKRPYIILKWAQSYDHKIAGTTRRPVKISHEITDRIVHKWRSEEDAIMVGKGTAEADNPSLTTRLWKGKNPVRIVIDKNLELPADFNLMDDKAQTIIINSIKETVEGNRTYCKVYERDNLADDIVRILYRHNISSVIVEGGARLLHSFLQAGLWDEARVITNRELVIGDGISVSFNQQQELVKRISYMTDDICYYLNTGKQDFKNVNIEIT